MDEKQIQKPWDIHWKEKKKKKAYGEKKNFYIHGKQDVATCPAWWCNN